MKPSVSNTRGDHVRRPFRWGRAVLVMLHPIPVLCVLFTTVAFIMVLDSSPSVSTLVRLVGTMAGIQLAIGVLNDYVDLPIDRQTKPWKPLVSGDLQPDTALWLTGGGLAAALLIVAPLGFLVTSLAMLGAAAGMIYNLYLKRTAWSWMPYLVALPLLPIWVWTALRGWDARLLLYPLGSCMAVALYLADTLPDIQADTAYGINGFAHRLGERRARLICWLFAGLAPTLVMLAAFAGLAHLTIVVPTAVLAWLLIATAITYSLRAQRWEWRLHFALLAAAASILGIGWLLALG